MCVSIVDRVVSVSVKGVFVATTESIAARICYFERVGSTLDDIHLIAKERA